MEARSRQAVRFAAALAGGLFVAVAGWYLDRCRIPPWVEAYSRPSRAARLLSEHDHKVLAGNRSRP